MTAAVMQYPPRPTSILSWFGAVDISLPGKQIAFQPVSRVDPKSQLWQTPNVSELRAHFS
jgi:hypothetical protein